MSEQLLVSDTQMYFGSAVLLAIGAVLFGLLALRESGYRRFVLLLGVLPAAAMAVAYATMGLELLTVTVTGTGGREQSMARFLSYTVILVTVPYVLRELVGLSRRQFGLLCLALVVMPWIALVSWVTTGVVETAASAGAFAAYLAAVYLFYGPLARIARTASGERRLLYLKLCHLAVLCWGTLILTSALSEQSAGLLDFFVGQFVASFVDLVFMLTFAALLYHSRSTFDERLVGGVLTPAALAGVSKAGGTVGVSEAGGTVGVSKAGGTAGVSTVEEATDTPGVEEVTDTPGVEEATDTPGVEEATDSQGSGEIPEALEEDGAADSRRPELPE